MTTSSSAGSLIIAVLLSDALTAEGPPVLKFLTAFGAAAGDPIKIGLAWAGLQGDIIASLPGLEATLSQQIASALTSKIQAALAAAQAKANPPAATSGSSGSAS